MQFYNVKSLKSLYIKNYEVFVETTGIHLDQLDESEVIMLTDEKVDELVSLKAFTPVVKY